MFQELLKILFEGNNEVLLFVIVSILCVAPLILIWRSTYVTDRSYSLQTDATIGLQFQRRSQTNHTQTRAADQTVPETNRSTPVPDAGITDNSSPNITAQKPTAASSEVDENAATNFSPEPSSELNNEQPSTSQSPNVQSPSGSSTSHQTQKTSIPELLPDHHYIRLKFLDETVQVVQAKTTDTIGEFRRKIFPSSLEERYRLIYQGNVLRNNQLTLRDCGVIPMEGDDSSSETPVIHCFLAPPVDSNPPTSSNSSLHARASVEDLSIGHFFLPSLGCILGVLWYLCINYTSLFTIPSIFGIIGLTCFFIVLVVNRFL